MSVLFAEIDRNNSVASASLNGCGGSVHNPQVQPQNKEQTNSLAAVAAAAAAANSLEEQRALQLAFELSMLGLSDSLSGCNGNGVVGSDLSVNIGLNGVNSGCHQSPSSLSPGGSAGGGMNSVISNNVGLNAFSSMMPSLEDRSKKSQNMTECVPVPSSEHVAEIVGRQGCKIKALRAKTNTYIKTPVRGEEPVFVVTGRKEDVAKAKREILSAAEHFSLIRASRKPTLGGLSGKGTPAGPPANIPGQITIQVRVPYRVVGLVVGPKGATIKHIQQQTHTYIVTPSRDKEPVFEVTGQSDNVQSARRQIEAHIALRTGTTSNNIGGVGNGNVLNGLNNGLGSLLGNEDTPELLASLYKNGLGSLFGYLEPNGTQDSYNGISACANNSSPASSGVGSMLQSSIGSSGCSSTSSSSSSTSSKSTVMTLPELVNIWKQSETSSIDVDEGLGESPNIWSMPTSSIIGSRSSPAASASPTDSLLASMSGNGNNLMSNGIATGIVNVGLGGMSINGLTSNVTANILNHVKQNQHQRECLVCGDKEVTAALVPCGHNMFCLDCANRICSTGDAACPICSETVLQAIRIIA